ncbi:phospholipid carrier-dependent glycosyltransferase [Chryseobacterium carnipullorum]|uniref:Phospholipid carrier-dependent glycosyltransferase n=1 Tax=Chryseobacterium carnipullorum TaxID=1124835 RepID=A0A376DQC9_CHRCU|nr:glycosyltransferase family 39 protein [Chryseobacterium carnipullorum]AZA48819.1 phospholipid carrier-dependent glycosyltransferase [Chryseobacterium carnipullorum]AZA63727.1 phospholipid carrier-dependent glycosyltransferase [Chryseobacterium carnipullorum]STC93280.1 Predicted membrane protein [Chryseobacterium carnipullorum]
MKKNYLILFFFIIAKFILQYSLISPEYELHRDEYLHLDQGNHLAWGYLSVPPVNSWLAWLIRIAGNSVFWVKFFPALFGALTIVVVWKIIEELQGSLYAKILASTGILLSILLRLNMLFQPTSLEVLLWALIYYTLIRYFNSEKAKWLYAAAVIFGIGFLNKYNIVFSVLGIIPAVLLTKQRKIFLQPHLYGAAAVALLIMLPNLLWQYNHHFPVVHHMKELEENQLVHVNRIDFFKSQILFFIGSFLVIIAGWYAVLFYKPFEKFKSFFWMYVLTIALFVFFKAKDYYTIGLYPVFIAFGAVFLAHIFENGWKKFLKPVFILIPVLLFLPLYQVAFPNKSPEYIINHPEFYKKMGMLRWEDGKDHALPQDFADMQGWEELAQKVDREYSRLSKSGETLVLCDNYGQAGAINYYSKKGVQAVSFNADYINWFDLNKKYDHLIRVKEFSREEDELKETGPYFENSKAADSIVNKFAREKGTTIFSFEGAKIDIKKRIQNEIDERKW